MIDPEEPAPQFELDFLRKLQGSSQPDEVDTAAYRHQQTYTRLKHRVYEAVAELMEHAERPEIAFYHGGYKIRLQRDEYKPEDDFLD